MISSTHMQNFMKIEARLRKFQPLKCKFFDDFSDFSIFEAVYLEN